MLPSPADIAARLTARAEEVCRHYLSNGRRARNYWQVGNVANEPGQSTTHATEQWPALIAAITDGNGGITAIQRTFLSRDGQGKAPFDNPRRSLGLVHGYGIRLGWLKDCLMVGEGLESMLSLRQLLPGIPAIAATSAAHVALLQIPRSVRRLYIASDNDKAGDHAAELLTRRVEQDGGGCRILRLRSVEKDFNDDVCRVPRKDALANLAEQIAREDEQYLGR